MTRICCVDEKMSGKINLCMAETWLFLFLCGSCKCRRFKKKHHQSREQCGTVLKYELKYLSIISCSPLGLTLRNGIVETHCVQFVKPQPSITASHTKNVRNNEEHYQTRS